MAISLQKLEELYHRYVNNQLTPEELNYFLNEIGNDSSEFQQDAIIQLFDKTWNSLKSEPGKYPLKVMKLHSSIENKVIQLPSRFKWSIKLFAAASVLLTVISSSLFLYFHSHPTKISSTVIAKPMEPMVVPGRNNAVLTLGNGTKVNLNQVPNGQISTADNTSIVKQQNGQLVYSSNENGIVAVPAYNTISTPNGGQYKVVLSDGTMVWLNAASSLTYPTAFKGIERHVELSGEAYFEVAKNKNMPFTITANKVHIQVLGTHFNVMAYADEAAVNTTLLEGSVKLNFNDKSAILEPGQQGIILKNSANIILKNVDVADAIAWKNQYFSFRKESLQSAMRKIARWYDLDIEYLGDTKNKMLGGSVSRTQSIAELLEYLELTGIVHFKLEGRKIIVTPK